MMNNTESFDKDLNPVLEIASTDDLDALVGYITKKGVISEALARSDAYKKYSPEHTQYADLIAEEIRDMGGNTFANCYRGYGPAYHEIVCDVAKKIGAPFNEKRDIETIENAILEKILEQALEEMTEQEKQEMLEAIGEKASFNKGSISSAALLTLFRAGGFKSYQLLMIIANAIAKAILGRGLTLAGNALLVRVASVATGPLGWAVTGIWAAADIAGPAYRVTIPCVVHIAMLRKKYNSAICPKCDAYIPDTTAKFCTECGNKLN